MTAKELYDHDFVEWTRTNAALLRAGRVEEIDLDHLAEEIEDMGASQERDLRSRLRVLLAHLLKLRAEPGSRASQGWKTTVRVQRDEIRQLLERAPSLKRRVTKDVTGVYRLAVSGAAAGTDLPEGKFPKTCPFSVGQILNDDFFP